MNPETFQDYLGQPITRGSFIVLATRRSSALRLKTGIVVGLVEKPHPYRAGVTVRKIRAWMTETWGFVPKRQSRASLIECFEHLIVVPRHSVPAETVAALEAPTP